MKCRNCGINVKVFNDEHFLYCSNECKISKKEQRRNNFINEIKTHNPWDRIRIEEKIKIEKLMGKITPIHWTKEMLETTPLITEVNEKPHVRLDGAVDKRSAGFRKCGKCGKTGHNARTCKG